MAGNETITFRFQAVAANLDTLEIIPACNNGQVWNYVTPAEIHPQLCAFRQVYSNSNPFFVLRRRKRTHDGKTHPTDSLPVMSPEEHARVVAQAPVITDYSYFQQVRERFCPSSRFMVQGLYSVLMFGLAALVIGIYQGSLTSTVVGAVFFALGLTIVGLKLFEASASKRRMAEANAIKQSQLQQLEYAIMQFRGEGYCWTVITNEPLTSPRTHNYELMLHVLDPQRLVRAAEPARAAAQIAEQAVQYPTAPHVTVAL